MSVCNTIGGNFFSYLTVYVVCLRGKHFNPKGTHTCITKADNGMGCKDTYTGATITKSATGEWNKDANKTNG